MLVFPLLSFLEENIERSLDFKLITSQQQHSRFQQQHQQSNRGSLILVLIYILSAFQNKCYSDFETYGGGVYTSLLGISSEGMQN
jgi:hypothetical protein